MTQQAAGSAQPPAQSVDTDYIFIKSDQRMVKIPFSDIIYAEGQSEYVKIFICSGAFEKPLLSLNLLEQRLPTEKFMRVHRSYIINLDYIVEVSYNRILLNNGSKIPIGEVYREQFTNFINKNLIKR